MNISKTPEKTMERIREAWRPLDSAKRNEILTLADMKKVSVERAYKTGGASAKVVVAIAQVLDIDPLYLIGDSDNQGSFDNDRVIKMLTELGYNVDKSDIARKRTVKPQVDTASAANTAVSEMPPSNTAVEEITKIADTANAEEITTSYQSFVPRTETSSTDLSAMSVELSKLLSPNAKYKLDDLTEDDTILLLKSLNVQANFSEEKKNRLALVKCMLLL